MAYQTILPRRLRERGLTVELVPGWETRGSSVFSPGGAVCHWTAGPRNSRTRPSLNICVNGRPGLPGPLCNVYLDRNGVAVVVAAGRANHAGVGGWQGLRGNSSVFGTEAEAAGPDDWTDAQRWAYPRINAAYADIGGFDADMVCGHSEWAGPRKQDINDYPMSGLRQQVAAILTGTQGDDMYDDHARAEVVGRLDEAVGLLRAIHPAVASLQIGVLDPTGGLRTIVLQMAGREPVEVDAAELAATLAPLLAPALADRTSATRGDVEAAIREVLGGLDGVTTAT